MFLGGGLFLIITLIGELIAKKEAMGFGDIKLIGTLGLFLGKTNIISTIIIAFLIAAIASIIMLVISKIRKKKIMEYIAFGPFIALASAIVVYIPNDIFIMVISKILRII